MIIINLYIRGKMIIYANSQSHSNLKCIILLIYKYKYTVQPSVADRLCENTIIYLNIIV